MAPRSASPLDVEQLEGKVKEIYRLVAQLRARWPHRASRWRPAWSPAPWVASGVVADVAVASGVGVGVTAPVADGSRSSA